MNAPKGEESIFAEALRLPPEQRAAYLAQATQGNAELRQEVESLLQSYAAGDFLDQAGASQSFRQTLNLAIPVTEKPGDLIGCYKLLQQIGEGGCGVVYMAEQEEPIRRRVALKIIKLGMDTKSVIARFEAERQALAVMDHPNIAKVLDAGATQTGRPYFVMELVRGLKITDYCDKARLSTNARLDLFIQVCQAIQHAHQKGIIHRDIKPSNILVSANDGMLVTKVIDFGIAKATSGQKLTDKTLFTAFEQFIGTPAYMSPEQAVITNVDIDTRSDIYALGVLLYELLTGKTPFDGKELLAIGLDEMRRTIRDQEPPRPSTRLSTLPGQELSTTAQRRGIEAPKLVSELRGDLDWIVMKTLEKDRARRYETANGLAADIQRHLKNEPVVACPPSRLYRFEKTVHRNKLAFAAAAAVIAALVIGLALAAWSYFKEKESRRQAVAAGQQAEANFLTARAAIDRMFTRAAVELSGQPRMDQTRRKLLEDALQFYEGFVKQKADDPEVQHGAALAYFRVGDIYRRLGRDEKCLERLAHGVAMFEVLALRQPLTVSDREELAEAYSKMAYASFLLRPSMTESLELRQKEIVVREALCRDFPKVSEYLRNFAFAQVDLGNVLKRADQPNEAIDHFRQALALCEKHRTDFPAEPEDRVLVAHANHWLGASLEYLYRLEEAEQAYRIAHDLREQLVAENPTRDRLKFSLAHVKHYLATLLKHSGRREEAVELLRAAVALNAKVLEDFPDVADYAKGAGDGFEDFGRLLAVLGRSGEAEVALRRSIAIREKLAADVPDVPIYADGVAHSCYSLGLSLAASGKPGEATQIFRRAFRLWEQLATPPPKTRGCERHLAWMLVTCPQIEFRDPARALMLAKQSLQSEGQTAAHWTLLGIAQYRTGDLAGAIESLHKSMEIARGGDAHQSLFLAMAHWQKGEHQHAREWYDKAVARLDKVPPSDDESVRFRAEATELMQISQGKVAPARAGSREER